jgi:hypothetical protein
MAKDEALPADLVCKILHHNVFATYSIHIYRLLCERKLKAIVWFWIIDALTPARPVQSGCVRM